MSGPWDVDSKTKDKRFKNLSVSLSDLEKIIDQVLYEHEENFLY